MAVYHLHWRGERDGTQTGWYIQNTLGDEVGRIEWRDGSIIVVYMDGSVFRDCGISHGASFAAASDLVEVYARLAEDEANRVDFPT